MQLIELKKELRLNSELVELVETLKNIAASQYFLLERQKKRFEEFMEAFSGFFETVNLVNVEDPLVQVSSDVLGIVIVTSDSGFMGGLNQSVIRAALDAQGDLTNQQTQLIIVGEKGAGVLSDQGREFKYFPGIHQTTIYEQSLEVRDYIVDEVRNRRIGRVVIAYPKALSFTTQEMEVVDILPCDQLFARTANVAEAEPTRMMNLLSNARKAIVESSFEDLVAYLANTWVECKLFEVFEDSKIAEFSARAMHLEGSFQKLEEEKVKLRNASFKAIHYKIDKGMRESFAALIKNRKDRNKE